MSEESIWDETFDVIRRILGLQQRNPPKPPPLKPMTQDEVDQWGAQYQNRMVSEQLRQPGAMILDTPLSRARSWEEMMDDFNRTGVTQRPGTLLKEKDLPPGTLTTRAIGTKPRGKR